MDQEDRMLGATPCVPSMPPPPVAVDVPRAAGSGEDIARAAVWMLWLTHLWTVPLVACAVLIVTDTWSPEHMGVACIGGPGALLVLLPLVLACTRGTRWAWSVLRVLSALLVVVGIGGLLLAGADEGFDSFDGIATMAMIAAPTLAHLGFLVFVPLAQRAVRRPGAAQPTVIAEPQAPDPATGIAPPPAEIVADPVADRRIAIRAGARCVLWLMDAANLALVIICGRLLVDIVYARPEYAFLLALCAVVPYLAWAFHAWRRDLLHPERRRALPPTAIALALAVLVPAVGVPLNWHRGYFDITIIYPIAILIGPTLLSHAAAAIITRRLAKEKRDG